MKILQLCNKPPIPSVDGGCIAMKASAEAILAGGNHLKVLAAETPKHPFIKFSANQHFVNLTHFETVFIDTTVKPFKILLNLFSSKSYNVSRFWSPDFNNKLIQILQSEKYNIIQLESIYVAPYIDTIRIFSSHSKIILRAHNVENELWFKQARNEKNLLKSLYYNLIARRLKKYEREVVHKVDAVAAISPKDAKRFSRFNALAELKAIPLNIEINNNWNNSNNKITLFYIGSLDWKPNLEGLKWFLQSVWPEIYKQMPYLRFYIAGKKMPDKMKNRKIAGVIFEGEVKDARAFMNSKKIMIVPLFSGSGVRVKILEAMSCGKTVISTSLGAEGLECEKNKNILIADNATEFIDDIKKCVNNPALCVETGLNALAFVKNNFSTESIAARYSSLYEEVLKK